MLARHVPPDLDLVDGSRRETTHSRALVFRQRGEIEVPLEVALLSCHLVAGDDEPVCIQEAADVGVGEEPHVAGVASPLEAIVGAVEKAKSEVTVPWFPYRLAPIAEAFFPTLTTRVLALDSYRGVP